MSTPHLLARRAGALGASATLATGTLAALITAMAGPAGAVATTHVVDSAGDGPATGACTAAPNDCTLRDAVAIANDGDTITFDPSISLITLTEGSLRADAVNIIGPGSSSLTITTTGAPGTYSVFYLAGTGDIVLSGFTVTRNNIRIGGIAPLAGGVTVGDVTVSGARSSSSGGAIFFDNAGDVSISNSNFIGNSTDGDGAAIYAGNSGDVDVDGTTFDDNEAASTGGAIYLNNDVVDFTLSNSTVTGNSVLNYGGGAAVYNRGDVTITDSFIARNHVTASGGGGVYLSNEGAVTVGRTTFDGNDSYSAGALYINEDIDRVTIEGSTISNNAVDRFGGGILSQHGGVPITIANSTFTGNSASEGGAIYLKNGDLVLEQVTIAANGAASSGGGIFLGRDFGTLSMSGTIASANVSTGGRGGGSIATTVTGTPGDIAVESGYLLTIESDHSLIGTVGTGVTVTDMGGTVRTDDPGLTPLADNGGPTMTMGLATTSPAVDAGPDPVADFSGNDFDQRGTPWVRVWNGTVDIGAFEWQPEPQPEPEPEPTTTTSSSNDEIVPTFTG